MDETEKNVNTKLLNSLVLDPSDASSLETLLGVTYSELRNLAAKIMRRERNSHTLQPTALVSEAYLRIFESQTLNVQGRTHFCNLAASVMRRVLVDHARGKGAAKRGGDWQQVTLRLADEVHPDKDVGILDLNAALEDLALLDQRAANVVELRVFGGLSMEEIASLFGLTRRTVQKDWRFALVWLKRELDFK